MLYVTLYGDFKQGSIYQTSNLQDAFLYQCIIVNHEVALDNNCETYIKPYGIFGIIRKHKLYFGKNYLC